MSCYGLTLCGGYLPCFHLGVPLGIPLSALYLDVGCDYHAYLNSIFVDVVIQKGDSYFSWVLVLRLEDKHLLAPLFTCLARASLVWEHLHYRAC